MELGFDPTRLKEISLDGKAFIFERIQSKQLPDLKQKETLLKRVGVTLPGTRVRNALMKTNPSLLVIRDRGNAYVLRRKVSGIHWEEALEQIYREPQLKMLDDSLSLRRLIRTTVGRAMERVSENLESEAGNPNDLLACFVSWNLETNRPLVQIDPAGTFLNTIWLA